MTRPALPRWIPLVLLCFSFASLNAQVDPNEPVYALAEQMPEFPGGTSGLRNWLAQHMEFPEEALEATITGPIQVSFVVGSDGAVRQAQVVRGQHDALDAEALRLVNSMPPWTPGRQRGRSVSVLYTLPIRFSARAAVAQTTRDTVPKQLTQAK